MTGKKGTTLMFVGLLQHGARTNNSKKSRGAVLGQYIPKFVRPMENFDRDIPEDSIVRKRAS